jgi:alpha-D-xyloside xylohydrolase
VPWLFDEEAVDVLRLFTRLKARLMPHLLGAARETYGEGIPMMRSMVVEFPDDPAVSHLDRQYMLGGDLLVAPVFSADGETAYYVPEGTWTHVLTGEQVAGGRWVRERHGFLSVPLLARPGSVIPMGAVEDRPDYAYAEGVTLHAYALPDGARVTTEVPDASGEVAATFTTTRDGDVVTVTARDAANWRVLLVGVRSGDVESGTIVENDQGLLVEAAGDTVTIRGIS